MSEEDILELAELLDDFIRMDTGDSSKDGRRVDQLVAYRLLSTLQSYGLSEKRIVKDAQLTLL